MKDRKETQVLSIILGGGKGTRLYPLTKERSKPAVSFGGKYRIVDIPISNCINSGLNKIFLLTQFNSASLHHHIAKTYQFDRFSNGFVEILAAEQTIEHEGWYEGTADSVRKNLKHFKDHNPTHYIILSGDQLYKMDLNEFLDEHIASGADITIATKAVPDKEAQGFGIMKINQDNEIVSFIEKPKSELLTDEWKAPGTEKYLASMGIYIFNADVMDEMLNNYMTDFGKEIIPLAITKKKVRSYIFDGYWEDIGTIKNFYDASMELTKPIPKINFYNEKEPFYTHPRNLPPSKINHAEMTNTLASEGCVISDSKIVQSVIGVRSIIREGCELNGILMMGADYYESYDSIIASDEIKRPHIGIGKNCKINKCIIDKNSRIGNNCRINVDGKNYENGDHGTYFVADGIIVIRKGAIIPEGTVI